MAKIQKIDRLDTPADRKHLKKRKARAERRNGKAAVKSGKEPEKKTKYVY